MTTTTETTCPACNGSGLYLDADDWGGEVVCAFCLGEGVRSPDSGPCRSCEGTGWEGGRVPEPVPSEFHPDESVDWKSDIHEFAECDDRVAV